MKATGSKLIKVAEASGKDVLQDTDNNAVLVDYDGKLIVYSTVQDALNEIAKRDREFIAQ